MTSVIAEYAILFWTFLIFKVNFFLLFCLIFSQFNLTNDQNWWIPKGQVTIDFFSVFQELFPGIKFVPLTILIFNLVLKKRKKFNCDWSFKMLHFVKQANLIIQFIQFVNENTFQPIARNHYISLAKVCCSIVL